jgi:hypothetical protein
MVPMVMDNRAAKADPILLVVVLTPCTVSSKGRKCLGPGPVVARTRPQDSRRFKAQYDGGDD